MPQWSAVPDSGFQLVFNPGDDAEERVAFTISDIEDALDYGRVERHDPFDKQLSGTAYHMVLNMNVCKDERIFERPWVILRSGKIIGRNHSAIGVH